MDDFAGTKIKMEIFRKSFSRMKEDRDKWKKFYLTRKRDMQKKKALKEQVTEEILPVALAKTLASQREVPRVFSGWSCVCIGRLAKPLRCRRREDKQE